MQLKLKGTKALINMKIIIKVFKIKVQFDLEVMTISLMMKYKEIYFNSLILKLYLQGNFLIRTNKYLRM